jgi:hypothetical protein
MGGGKSSGSSQATLTPEQKQLLQVQTNALTNTFLPAYQNTIGMANSAFNQTAPNANAAANTASNVAAQTGQLQQQIGSGAYQSGTGGQQSTADYQRGLGQGLTGAGAGGVGSTAAYQQGLGQNLTGAGANSLAQLFSPQYAQEQVNAALEPAMEQTREAMSGQNASYGAAGGLGSSRAALAQANLQSLSNQRLGTVAAQTKQGIEANRAAASQALLGAGQNATSQAGGLFSNLLNAGQGATGQAGALYGNLAGQGSAGMNAANQAAASRIGYAGTPQDILSKYASVIYGTPQASTTPNFAGTQGQTTSSKGGGFKI